MPSRSAVYGALDWDLATSEHDHLLAMFTKSEVLRPLFDALFPHKNNGEWHLVITPQVPVIGRRAELLGGYDVLAEAFHDSDDCDDETTAISFRLLLYLMTKVENIGAVLRELNTHALYEEHMLPCKTVLVVAQPCPGRHMLRQSHIFLVERLANEGWRLWQNNSDENDVIMLPYDL